MHIESLGANCNLWYSLGWLIVISPFFPLLLQYPFFFFSFFSILTCVEVSTFFLRGDFNL